VDAYDTGLDSVSLDNEPCERVTDSIDIPLRVIQQALSRIRGGLAAHPRHMPSVLPPAGQQQPLHVLCCPAAHLRAPKERGKKRRKIGVEGGALPGGHSVLLAALSESNTEDRIADS